MYIVGENPVLSDADANHVTKFLNNLDFLVVQDIFLTETARLADVVLPPPVLPRRKVLLPIPNGGYSECGGR